MPSRAHACLYPVYIYLWIFDDSVGLIRFELKIVLVLLYLLCLLFFHSLSLHIRLQSLSFYVSIDGPTAVKTALSMVATAKKKTLYRWNKSTATADLLCDNVKRSGNERLVEWWMHCRKRIAISRSQLQLSVAKFES